MPKMRSLGRVVSFQVERKGDCNDMYAPDKKTELVTPAI